MYRYAIRPISGIVYRVSGIVGKSIQFLIFYDTRFIFYTIILIYLFSLCSRRGKFSLFFPLYRCIDTRYGKFPVSCIGVSPNVE